MNKLTLLSISLIFSGCLATTTNRDMKPHSVAPVSSREFWQEKDWNSERSTPAPVTTWDDPWSSDPVAGYNDLPKQMPSEHLDTPPTQGEVY